MLSSDPPQGQSFYLSALAGILILRLYKFICREQRSSERGNLEEKKNTARKSCLDINIFFFSSNDNSYQLIFWARTGLDITACTHEFPRGYSNSSLIRCPKSLSLRFPGHCRRFRSNEPRVKFQSSSWL